MSVTNVNEIPESHLHLLLMESCFERLTTSQSPVQIQRQQVAIAMLDAVVYSTNLIDS